VDRNLLWSASRQSDSESKAARTRVRILDAAAHVLSIKGYAGTRLCDVASSAEVAAPAIYYYFSSRDDLIEEVMYAGIADMRVHLRKSLDALPPGTPMLERILVAVERLAAAVEPSGGEARLAWRIDGAAHVPGCLAAEGGEPELVVVDLAARDELEPCTICQPWPATTRA